MFSSNNNYAPTSARDTSRALSVFMSSVYLWMMVGITISGLVAYSISSNPAATTYIMQRPFIFYGLILFQLGAVIALSGFVQRMSLTTASGVYVGYAALTGVTFSVLFQVYTMQSISAAFFTTAFSFAGLSVFGYTTKKDLGPVASFCMMGLFGMIGMMILGFFIPSMMSNTMQLMMSAVGVIVFAGLTAYDTQRIKAMQYQFATAGQAKKGAIYGALVLYLDFINLFISLLRLMGDRK